MINLRKLFWSIFYFGGAFIIGALIGREIIIYYDAYVFKIWSWKNPPAVINCYGPELNETYIHRAVDYWAVREEHISFIESNPPRSVCKDSFIEGFIIFRKATKNDISDTALAVTKRKMHLGKLKSAEIYFRPGTYNLDYIIEHELGHAFGYTHLEEEGHIMHPIYNKMGPKFWIP